MALVTLPLLALALGACDDPPRQADQPEPIVVRVAPFEVHGQNEGADYVGTAFARSLAVRLSQAEGLRLPALPGSEGTEIADVEAARVITGSLTREGEAVHADLAVVDPANNVTLWQTGDSSANGDLSELAYRLAARTAQSVGVSYPDLYKYIGNVLGDPGMADTPLLAQVQLSWRHNDIPELLETSSRLVAENPDDPAGLVVNAWALMLAWDAEPTRQDQLTRLKQRLTALDRVDPTSPYDELLLAYIYRSSGQPREAIELYTRVLARPNLTNVARAWALRQRSFSHMQTGNAPAARNDAEEAVELDPANAMSHAALSKALEALNLLDEAILRAREGVALQPASWRDLQRLGLAYSRAGLFDDGTTYIDQACRLGHRQEACANLAVSLQRAGREDEAFAAAEHAESLAGSPWGLYNLGCYWSVSGQRSRALSSLRRSFELGYTDVLINTDPDLEFVRGDPIFNEIVGGIEERIRIRREVSTSVFPWQG